MKDALASLSEKQIEAFAEGVGSILGFMFWRRLLVKRGANRWQALLGAQGMVIANTLLRRLTQIRDQA